MITKYSQWGSTSVSAISPKRERGVKDVAQCIILYTQTDTEWATTEGSRDNLVQTVQKVGKWMWCNIKSMETGSILKSKIVKLPGGDSVLITLYEDGGVFILFAFRYRHSVEGVHDHEIGELVSAPVAYEVFEDSRRAFDDLVDTFMPR